MIDADLSGSIPTRSDCNGLERRIELVHQDWFIFADFQGVIKDNWVSIRVPVGRRRLVIGFRFGLERMTVEYSGGGSVRPLRRQGRNIIIVDIVGVIIVETRVDIGAVIAGGAAAGSAERVGSAQAPSDAPATAATSAGDAPIGVAGVVLAPHLGAFESGARVFEPVDQIADI